MNTMGTQLSTPQIADTSDYSHAVTEFVSEVAPASEPQQESAPVVECVSEVAPASDALPESAPIVEFVSKEFDKVAEYLNHMGIQRNPQYFKDRVGEVPAMLERIVLYLELQARQDATGARSVFAGVTNLMSIFIMIGDIDCIDYVLKHNVGALDLKGISAYSPLINYWKSNPQVAREMVAWLNANGATWVDNPTMLELHYCPLDFIMFLFNNGVYYSAYEAARPYMFEYMSLIKMSFSLKQHMIHPDNVFAKVSYLLKKKDAFSFITAEFVNSDDAADAIAVVDAEAVVAPDALENAPATELASETRPNYGDKYMIREFMQELVCFDVNIVTIIYSQISADVGNKFATLHLDNLMYCMPFDNSEFDSNPTYKLYLDVVNYILVNYPHIFSQLAFGNRLHLAEMCKEGRVKYDYMQCVNPDDAAMYLKK